MPKTALIVRQDKSGLGQGQTLRLTRLLKPDKLMIIDSGKFNGSQQYPEWYKDYESVTINGFPTDVQTSDFLKDVDTILTCETFYNMRFTKTAQEMGVKTILIANPEFCDFLQPHWGILPKPDIVVVPSQWLMEAMQSKLNASYLPTPIFADEFEQAREVNLNRTGKTKFLFINGKTAHNDRNGLESLYEALQHSKGDFTVTIKAQNDVKKHPDPRIRYDFSNPIDQVELYTDYDALILPRRYAGQSLPMTEALQSALPVVMTDIDPNNKVLPSEWLIPATKTGTFMARIPVDIYTADTLKLAEKIDIMDVDKEAKIKALELGKQYDAEHLRPAYKELLKW